MGHGVWGVRRGFPFCNLHERLRVCWLDEKILCCSGQIIATENTSFLTRKSPALSGKSRLVKYYCNLARIIW